MSLCNPVRSYAKIRELLELVSYNRGSRIPRNYVYQTTRRYNPECSNPYS